MLANILDGIMNAISMGSLLANLMGVTLGIIFGALPGLTAAMGVALLIPLTFGMPAVEAFSALLGMYGSHLWRLHHRHSRRHAGYCVRRRDHA